MAKLMRVEKPLATADYAEGGNGKFVGDGEVNEVLTSDDRTNWTERQLDVPGGIVVNGIAYATGLFVAAGSWWNDNDNAREGRLFTSTDGVTWIPREPGTRSPLKGVGYGQRSLRGGGRLSDCRGFRSVIITLTIKPNLHTDQLALSLTTPDGTYHPEIGDYIIQDSSDLITWRTLTAPPLDQSVSVLHLR